MKATKLPSGKYRARAYLGRDDHGRIITKSFTAPTAASAISKASAFEHAHKNRVDRSTLDHEVDVFINAKLPLLSPSTIRGYVSMWNTLKNHFGGIIDKPMLSITTSDLDAIVRAMITPHEPYHGGKHKLETLSPKTIENYIRFLSAVFRHHGMILPSVELPKKRAVTIYVPSSDEVRLLLDYAATTEMEIPIMLGALGGMRLGEICALRYPQDFNGNVAHIRNALAYDRDYNVKRKTPKSYTSDRFVPLHPRIMAAIAERGTVTELSMRQISQRFPHMLNRCELPHFRFHDLRHFFVSWLHSQGVPDAYIMQWTGHATDTMLKRVYRHTLADQSELFTKKSIESMEMMFLE